MKHLPLLVRREFWEHRAFVIAPAVVAVIWLLVALFGVSGRVHFDGLPAHLIAEPDLTAKAARGVAAALGAITLPFVIVMGVVIIFYLLDSLYADRRDRSVLFWKSLPVSDRATVLTKLATAALVLPAVMFVSALLTSVLVALIASIKLSIANPGIWALVWNPGVWLSAHALLLYVIVVAVLWYLPVFAYLLLVSAVAGRAVMLWAVLPPLGLMIAENAILPTDHVADLLGHRFGGWVDLALNRGSSGEHTLIIEGRHIPFSARLSEILDPATFFSSAGLWLGLLAAGLLMYAAISVRRHRSEV